MWSPVPPPPLLHRTPSPSFPHPLPLFPRRACPNEDGGGNPSLPHPLSSRMRGPIPFPPLRRRGSIGSRSNPSIPILILGPTPSPSFPSRPQANISRVEPALREDGGGNHPFPLPVAPRRCGIGSDGPISFPWPLRRDSGPSEGLPYPRVPFSVGATLVVAPSSPSLVLRRRGSALGPTLKPILFSFSFLASPRPMRFWAQRRIALPLSPFSVGATLVVARPATAPAPQNPLPVIPAPTLPLFPRRACPNEDEGGNPSLPLRCPHVIPSAAKRSRGILLPFPIRCPRGCGDPSPSPTSHPRAQPVIPAPTPVIPA